MSQELYPDEIQTPKSGRLRKKRKKKHYFLRFLIFIAAIALLYLIITSDLFAVKEVLAEDNRHYTDSQIFELSGVQLGTNIWEMKLSAIESVLKKDPYIDEAVVKRKFPNVIIVSVKERKEEAVLLERGNYIVIDYSGMVLRVMKKDPPALPLITSMKVTKYDPGEALQVKDNSILLDTLNLLKAVDQSDLYFSKITVSDVTIKAYIYSGLICEGTYDNIRNNLDVIAKVVADLGSKGIERGTITVSGSGTCSFSP